MALLPRICLLSFCVLLLGAPPTVAASPAVGTVANPARLPGSIPLAVPKTQARKKASLGARAVRIAARELGTPYRYGGMSPSGFDCSGLIAYVYGKLGVVLPHNAAAQFGHGRPVSRSHLRPGDLVFFHGLGHVGLYIGGGKIIHSPQSGERVEIQNLAERSGSVQGARRVVRS
ncbi:C40 family peptidase [Gaiella sp.]|uniref:C40 family peptidase n=1 Tax=Gaiella sp. TaxID=2663207 RepID=UPI00326494CC